MKTAIYCAIIVFGLIITMSAARPEESEVPIQAPMSSVKAPMETNSYSVLKEVPEGMDLKRWKLFAYNEVIGAWFLDNKTVTSNKGIVAAWVKQFPSVTEKATYESLCDKYQDINNIQVRIEVNCSSNQHRKNAFVLYGYDGEYLCNILRNGDKVWREIPPESILEELKNQICYKNKKNKKIYKKTN